MLNKKLIIKLLVLNFSGLALFIADRIIKYYLQNPGQLQGFVLEIFSFFSFRFAKNFGIAFSLPFYSPLLRIATSGILAIIILLSIKALKNKNFEYIAYLEFIFLGAASNFIDRMKYGYVIDYLDIPYFAIINIADIMISIGIIFIFLKEYKGTSVNKDITKL